MLDYIDKIIKPYIGGNKCLLLLDDYRAHQTDEVLNYFLSFDGNTQEDEEYDAELETINKVISDGLEFTKNKDIEMEINIQNTIDKVANVEYIIEIDENIFTV